MFGSIRSADFGSAAPKAFWWDSRTQQVQQRQHCPWKHSVRNGEAAQVYRKASAVPRPRLRMKDKIFWILKYFSAKPKLSRNFRQSELTVLWYFVDIFPVWSTCERNGFGYVRHLTFDGDGTCRDGSSGTQWLLREDW
ncbi:hypothetical protein RvY_01627 [Ramazzottius varieornatus]|uniref:Uncharacterized protein n=1 Tax=Ramazzottius varieornatus TaxID=947166 RepID=A0A1D1US85_RAMVA|nr:hypothetical protein RvY_01627 [Ramazzottius varieornatus]